MRVAVGLCLLAACAEPARAPVLPSNQGSTAPAARDDPDLEIESYVPRHMIQVSRDPDGAIRVLAPVRAGVYLDGTMVGIVPCVVPAPPPGRHKLTIYVDGY